LQWNTPTIAESVGNSGSSPATSCAALVCRSGFPPAQPFEERIERYVVDLERRNGYQHVYTPELAKRELYERSDHWAHYRDDMYPPMEVGSEQVVLRPMNCPITSSSSPPSSEARGTCRFAWRSSARCSGSSVPAWWAACRGYAR
jgi:hypothetical protein